MNYCLVITETGIQGMVRERAKVSVQKFESQTEAISAMHEAFNNKVRGIGKDLIYCEYDWDTQARIFGEIEVIVMAIIKQ